jgi:hypothetical protein
METSRNSDSAITKNGGEAPRISLKTGPKEEKQEEGAGN